MIEAINIVYFIIQSFIYQYTARLEEGDKYSCFDTNEENSNKKLSKTKIQLQGHVRRHQKIAEGKASMVRAASLTSPDSPISTGSHSRDRQTVLHNVI